MYICIYIYIYLSLSVCVHTHIHALQLACSVADATEVWNKTPADLEIRFLAWPPDEHGVYGLLRAQRAATEKQLQVEW